MRNLRQIIQGRKTSRPKRSPYAMDISGIGMDVDTIYVPDANDRKTRVLRNMRYRRRLTDMF